ncbi:MULTISPECIES: hypothetical protein [Enterococcus]|uniref:BppU N-terminal domain-containing protein n=1 Tax=Enterococcus dongliensis TaxID=2559925 RepID=A0ABU3ES08_9ENTE|nr:hypothetical protein [Enterococcus dongliensis]MDT2597641.1 hypothetical protein [Enterococcus dongliensis]
MSKPYFQFSKISNIEVATFDPSLKKFYEQGIEGTIKEDIQNALDARLTDSQEPVKLKITLGKISKQDLPGIKEVFLHINSLEGASFYTSETIDYMKKQESLSMIPVLTIEDTNTKGLSGAENGQSNNRKDTYGIYAYSKGVHSVIDDEQHEISRGGSHGIGKIANNSASDIHLMYFANCDEDGNKHLGGTVHLIEHKVDDQYYRSTGYFTDVINNHNSSKFIPFSNNNSSPIFSKESRGLKIIIPYLRKEFYNLKLIIQAICDNFFLAILNEKLEVRVEEGEALIDITKESIQDYIEDERLYETDITQMKDHFTPLYVRTYLDQDPIPIKVSSFSEEYDFDLYFTYNENIPTGRVGIIRTIGMKIEDFKVKSNIRRPFNAVLIGGSKEDQYLKSLENESHTLISAKSISDDQAKKNAIRFINNLNKEIGDIIDEHVQKNNPTDGVIDTSNLLYETETSFRNDLSKMKEKVSIVTGDSIFKKRSKKEKREPQKPRDENPPKNPTRKQVRNPRVLQPSDNKTNESVRMILPTDAVERSVTKDYEVLKFNFKGMKDFNKWDKCNISFKVVDGMGKEYSDEINLLDSYSSIYDFDTKQPYEYDASKISDVNISNGTIFLKMNFADRFNKYLKFLYVVEVEK